LADSGYFATKKLYYHGVHVIGSRQPGTLPAPAYIEVTGASAHDGKVLDQIRPYFICTIMNGMAVKLISGPMDAEAVRQAQNLTVLTPVKKHKGQCYLEPQDQWCSTVVSRARQPIEALLAWIEEKNRH
jgi:hypothetical protein